VIGAGQACERASIEGSAGHARERACERCRAGMRAGERSHDDSLMIFLVAEIFNTLYICQTSDLIETEL
jgi:hypothetical protein